MDMCLTHFCEEVTAVLGLTGSDAILTGCQTGNNLSNLHIYTHSNQTANSVIYIWKHRVKSSSHMQITILDGLWGCCNWDDTKWASLKAELFQDPVLCTLTGWLCLSLPQLRGIDGSLNAGAPIMPHIHPDERRMSACLVPNVSWKGKKNILRMLWIASETLGGRRGVYMGVCLCMCVCVYEVEEEEGEVGGWAMWFLLDCHKSSATGKSIWPCVCLFGSGRESK